MSNGNRSTRRRRVNQAVHADIPKANKIGASTPYGFQAHNLTAYGGLLPVTTMLEKLGFQQQIEQTLTMKRQTHARHADVPAHPGDGAGLLRGLFAAALPVPGRAHLASCWRVGVSYSDHYQEKDAFQRLTERLRSVARGPDGFAPVLATPLCA